MTSFSPEELEFIENIRNYKYGHARTIEYWTSLSLGYMKDSIVSIFILPYLVKMDHQPINVDKLIGEMFIGLDSKIKPLIYCADVPYPDTSYTDKKTNVGAKLGYYRALEFYREKAIKKREEDEAKKAREYKERKLAILERGELSIIGRKSYYVDKYGVVFDVNHPSGYPCYHESTMTPAMIMAQRGKHCFNSVREAEMFWGVHEEAKIMAEARRRMAEEDYEARVKAAMARLRSDETTP
jgi:hypothetical protein